MKKWTREEAIAYLDIHYRVDKMAPETLDKMVADLIEMRHRPWCRTHMAAIMPNYGSECTCGGPYD